MLFQRGCVTVKNITVLGSGVMGHGIAQVSATAGYNVVLRDIKQEFLDKAMEKIKWSLDKMVTKEKISKEEAKISDNQDNKNSKNAESVSSETTYESGEGDALLIPVVTTVTKEVPIKNSRGRTIGFKTVTVDDTELAMYGGK